MNKFFIVLLLVLGSLSVFADNDDLGVASADTVGCQSDAVRPYDISGTTTDSSGTAGN